MLHPNLLTLVRHELADEAGIPQLRRDAQILAAAHQRVGLAALGGGGDALGVEVLLFAAGDGDKSIVKTPRVSVAASLKLQIAM